jgi:hypothetical protein
VEVFFVPVVQRFSGQPDIDGKSGLSATPAIGGPGAYSHSVGLLVLTRARDLPSSISVIRMTSSALQVGSCDAVLVSTMDCQAADYRREIDRLPGSCLWYLGGAPSFQVDSMTRDGRYADVDESESVNYFEAQVATSLAECVRCDVKRPYALQRAGHLSGLTGVDDPDEIPVPLTP